MGNGSSWHTLAVNFRGFTLQRREDGAVSQRAAAGGRDGGQLVRAVPGVTLGRPPAVAVIGLRRSGRTGNGEIPAGASRPPARPGPQFTPESGARQHAQDDPHHEAHGALRAPLKT